MEFENNIPIYLQVVDEIKRLLMTGELKPGDKLWSARDMAILYKINPNTAARVYKELELEELCFTKRGLGTYLTEDTDVVNRLRNERAQKLTAYYVNGFRDLSFSEMEMRQFFEEAISTMQDSK